MALDKPKNLASPDNLTTLGKTVLVVDDSRAQRMMLCKVMERQGYTVHEAGSGLDALKICQSGIPDLVLSDWMMPGMDGLEFCEAFRSLPRDRYGYFILLTSRSDKEDVTRAFDAGADDFLTKPVNLHELNVRVRAGERIMTMEQELNDKNRIISSTLEELRAVHDSINRDLVEARKLQNSLVSERYRDSGKAEISLMLRSSGHVGGDLVGMFPIDDNRLGIYGIDVSGHGISSALMTARLAGFLTAGVPDQNIALRKMKNGQYRVRPPAETMSLLNERILSEIDTDLYFTMLLAICDQTSGEIVFSQAGHPSPVIQRASGSIETVGAGGLPVGLIESAEFDQCEVRLNPGDRFLIHSDGITECSTPSGDLYDDEGLNKSLTRHATLRGQACLDAILHDMVRFCGTDEFDDDVSTVLLELKADQDTA
ncbi:MAG: SpoIIE family protein phosphatase [Pseudomonadota bacterium]